MKLSASTFLVSCLLVVCLSLLASATATSAADGAEESYLPRQIQEILSQDGETPQSAFPEEPFGEPEETAQPSAELQSLLEIEPAEETDQATLEDIRTITFPDVTPGTPDADCISYAAHLGLLQGIEDGLFDPDGLVTRAMAVTVLYRMSGEETSSERSFSDVSPEDWFAPAVAWAAKAGIATGYEDGTFRPYLPVTRTQLSALLYRMAAYDDGRDYSAVLSRYQDSGSLPDYARESMAWALENRLFAGMVADTIYPKLSVTRAQLAQMLTALTAYSGGDALAETITDDLRVTLVSFTPQAHDLLQDAVNAAAKKYGAVGMQVAILHNGQLIDSFATGWATKNTDPMTVEHKIRVASLSKVDVAMAAMVLWDQGIIDLDESIGAYWGATMRNPYYKTTPVNIRSILSHTSSIRLFGDDVSLRRAAVKSKLTSSSGYSNVTPGSIYAYGYNNYAFGVLGMTLELAAGKNLNKVMEPIFSLMDLDVAYYSGDIGDPSLHTTIYRGGVANRSVATARNNVSPSTPGASGASFAGGFTASAKDQAMLVSLLANDGKFQEVPLLSERAVEFMESPMGYISDGGYYQCHPLRYQNDLYGRDTIYYHTGSAFGVYNLLSYDPDTGDGVVVLTSGASAAKDSRGIYAVCAAVSDTAYELMKDESQYLFTEYMDGYVLVEYASSQGQELAETAQSVETEYLIVTENGEEYVITTSPAQPEG